jgi:hypothetical protein
MAGGPLRVPDPPDLAGEVAIVSGPRVAQRRLQSDRSSDGVETQVQASIGSKGARSRAAGQYHCPTSSSSRVSMAAGGRQALGILGRLRLRLRLTSEPGGMR